MPDSYRPPHGTEPGTFHWFRFGRGNTLRVWWCIWPERWRDFCGDEYTSGGMVEEGWRYVGPCVPPPDRADE